MNRIEKVNNQIRKEISQIIRDQVDNPNLGMISITRVETSADLKTSKVYFSVFPESNTESAYKTLLDMKGFIKKLLGGNIRVKFLPDIDFVPDDSIKYSVDIYDKIERLKNEFKKDNRDNTE